MIERSTLLNAVFNEIERCDTVNLQRGQLVDIVKFGNNMQWRINNENHTTTWFFKNHELTLSMGNSEVERVKAILVKKKEQAK